jgi:hypothetical protein
MAPVVSTAVSESAIRPVLLSTFQAGAGRRRGTRRARGGFNPSVMGPFVANAQAAIAPMAMYSTFRLFKNSKKSKKSMKSSKKSAKKSSRKSAH